MTAEPKQRAEYSVIGTRVPRVDGLVKATGEAVYTIDMALPRMLYGKILFSPHPHALVKDIDASAALRLPGIKAVVTAQDTKGRKYGYFPIPQTIDEYPLAVGKVRYVGDAVAAVAAIDEDVAQEALDLIKVDYEVLPAVLDPLEAMKPSAPQIHDHAQDNVGWKVHLDFGDVETAFAQSYLVRQDSFRTQFVTHVALEPHACLASFDSSGKLTLWASTQSVYYPKMTLAYLLDLPETKVRVIKPHVGGGFGSKAFPSRVQFCASLLSMKSARPVKIVYNREEVFIASHRRNSMIIDLKTGVKKDGTILARECSVVADGGAYNNISPHILHRTGAQICQLYRVPNMRYTAYRVYTNKTPCGAFRGFGMIQAAFANDSQMDMIAEDLGIDPVEMRLRNAVGPNETTAFRWRITSCGLKECVEQVATKSGWTDKRISPGPHRGIGIACSGYNAGDYTGNDGSGAVVQLFEDGGVTLLTGASDMGQGSDTTLSQIAAEELGIAPEDIRIVSADSELTPTDMGSYASRATMVSGNAVIVAAADARRQLFEAVANQLEANVTDLEARDRRIYVKGSPERGISFVEAVKAAAFADKGGKRIIGRGSYKPEMCEVSEAETGAGNTGMAYSFGAQVAEVEVDPETGQVQVKKITAADDCGFAINPMSVEGMVEGSVALGLGFALSEVQQDKEGFILNPNLEGYAIPTALEMPDINVNLVETIDPAGPFGAKGISEGTTLPQAPAIASAIFHAVGVRLKELPMTPERLLNAMDKEKAG